MGINISELRRLYQGPRHHNLARLRRQLRHRPLHASGNGVQRLALVQRAHLGHSPGTSNLVSHAMPLVQPLVTAYLLGRHR